MLGLLSAASAKTHSMSTEASVTVRWQSLSKGGTVERRAEEEKGHTLAAFQLLLSP